MKLSFYKRVVVLLCGLVLLVQLFNLSAVLTTISQDVREEMRDDLQAASALVKQLAQRRSDLLLTSAEVLAADFGFRSAIASQDGATIVSALVNNVARIDADLATFVALDGSLTGTSSVNATDRDSYLNLAERSEQEGTAAATLVIGGYAREVVTVPVKAPITIGWLVLGFSLNDAIADAFAAQTGMQVTFAAEPPDYSFFGSSFNDLSRAAMPSAMRGIRQSDSGLITTIEKEEFLSRVVPISADQDQVVTLLHTSLDAALASYREVRSRLLLYMAASLFVALALGLAFARGVTRPVKLLSIAALRIREGDYQTDLDQNLDSQRSDEFGELIKTFNDMQKGIAERETKIIHHAYYDDLTQLPNRRKAHDQLKKLIEQLDPGEGGRGIVLLGLNRYKQIVETLGHAVGEQMVLTLSERLRVAHDYPEGIARVATDEFLIVCSVGDPEHCRSSARQMIDCLEAPILLNDAELVPEMAAGIVWLPDDADNAEDAIRRASIALADTRDAKESLGCYQAGRDERHIRRLSLVADLKRAVEGDELMMHFQPKISMQSREVGSVEALVRWIHPEHGFMPPDEFIGLAESSGNIGLITYWVLNAVIRQLSVWEAEGICLKAAVNLSALDLQDEALVQRIQALLDKHGIPASRLIVEVTESAMMRDTTRALAALIQMRSTGIAVSIDDFGTGYSSLAKLKDLPIDELKIDRAFVSDIKPGTAKALIIKAIIELGHSLDLTVISEGVETQEEWDLLDELGNDVVQGYLITRPLNAQDFSLWWHDKYPIDKHRAA